jgi:hypothetical protein
MKKLLLFTLIVFSSNLNFSQTNLFENPDFDKIAIDHKIIGVIPFKNLYYFETKTNERHNT